MLAKFDANLAQSLAALSGVSDEKLAEPWTMSEDEQREAGCVIGEDYPAPVVDHRHERRRALEWCLNAGVEWDDVRLDP